MCRNVTSGVVVRPTGALLALLSLAVTPTQAELRTISSKYYELHTDLDEAGAQEAVLRITLMAEEYHSRTRGLGGTVARRLPFYLFQKRADYHAAGGMPGSAGVYMGNRLMAVTDPRNPAQAWHTVQHEGFHQFADATIRGDLPIWANEGMAEYFGEGVFTGDQFYVGLIPPARLKRIQAGIRAGHFMPLGKMLSLSLYEWNAFLKFENYDQAWSMVHFLAHGENGRYEKAFMGFLRDIARQIDRERAWQQNFGADIAAFRKRWEEYWLRLPDDPTAALHAEIVTATLTSFYGRAIGQRQRFKTIEEFFDAAETGQLKMDSENWLPPTLLNAAMKQAPEVGEWSLTKRGRNRLLTCTMSDGTQLFGRFKLSKRRVKSTWVDVKPARKKKR